jgi:hypothetical protein
MKVYKIETSTTIYKLEKLIRIVKLINFEPGLTKSQISKKVNISNPYLADLLKILKLICPKGFKEYDAKQKEENELKRF